MVFSTLKKQTMIHIFLLIFGFYWVGVGIVICVLLFSVTMKAKKGIWLITIPGILVIAMLTIDFVCHMLHLPRHVVPYQAQVISTINWAFQLAVIPLLVMKLYEQWSKKRAQAILRSQDASPSK
jgi:cytochrome c biogenesis protein CcdA